MRTPIRLLLAATLFMAMAASPSANAFHLYRSTDGGCSETDGHLGATAEPAATVLMTHNLFLNGVDTYSTPPTLPTPVTHVHVGDTVKWTWNSLHCHSVQFDPNFLPGAGAYSGFHYPTTVPADFVNAVPGFFEYPQLSMEPTLSWSYKFNTAGQFLYICEHHVEIGMVGVVVVD